MPNDKTPAIAAATRLFLSPDAPPEDAPPPVNPNPPVAPLAVEPNEGRDAALRNAWRNAEMAKTQAEGIQSTARLDERYVVESPIDPVFRSLGYADNDTGAAERFLDWMGENLAYIYDWPQAKGGLWVVWHPDRGWLPDIGGGVIKCLATACARRMASPEAMGIDGKWAAKAGMASNMSAMLGLAKAKRTLPFASLDADPYLFAMLDCVIDLRTGNRRDFCKNEIITQRAGVEFMEGQTPTSVLRCFEGNYDPSDVLMLQEFLGSCLNGVTRDRLLCYWTGPTGNGKTTATKAIAAAMGTYADQVTVDLYTTSQHARETDAECARLAGKRFVFAPECDNGKTLSEARIKHLTGGDNIRYRALYGDAAVIRSTAKHLIYGNEKPTVDGRDDAFWGRILLIEATGGVTRENQDMDLQERACQNPGELAGMINWLLEGHARWVANGYRINLTERAKAAVEKYAKEEDTVGSFLDEITRKTPGEKTKTSTVYIAYKNWAMENGLRHWLSAKKFSCAVKKDFGEPRKIRGTWYWMDCEMTAEKGGATT